MSRPKITALIHTRNEERWIGQCLDSVLWADEIVVADMSSTDRTREIATAHGARLVDMPVVPYVDQVRNQAMRACTGDWLLVVDADETVSPGLGERVRAVTQSPEADAYWVPRRNYFFGEWLEHVAWPDPQLRLFRRGSASWSGTIHEPPSITGKTASLPDDPSGALEHPGCAYDMTKLFAKYQRYAAVEPERMGFVKDSDVLLFLLRRPLGEFLGRYFGGGWRHGVPGLVFCLVLTNYQIQIGAYLWDERRKRLAAQPPREVRRHVRWEFVRTALKVWKQG